MNTQGLLESFRKAVTLRVEEEERKQPTGVMSLLFSGAVFSLLGGTYLLKSGLLSSVQYASVADAVRKVDAMEEGKEVPVQVYGKIHRIIKGNDRCPEGYAIYKRTTELHSHVFDQQMNNWRDTMTMLESRVDASSFELITSNGYLFSVEVPEGTLLHNAVVLSLPLVGRRELCGEEAASYALDVERTHYAESTPIDEAIVAQEEGLKERQNVYVRGMLSKQGSTYSIRTSGSTKLTISSHSITEESEKQRTNGLMFCTIGIGLLLGGYYRSLCPVCNKHVSII